ncbi:DUF1501 domain-containing protein [Conexibacter sp. SYSU D00693]|uniref:DUF1501 domain-containing protein n=1 Tax=Conexibacter sp. SYSU D00693 TaxID=2812560 RepID=UPI00196AA6FD|nr:DUF1501 domain-containing protein [Conexibacter sp. SYSU D00693]
MASSHRHCRDFTRATLLHEAAARAGAGLPAVEAGMPLPAGTGLSRRRLLSRAVGGALAVYGASRLSPALLDDGIAHAAAGAGSDKVLVSVFLPGGADALSVLAPVGDPRYRQLRKTLALEGDAGEPFAEDPRLRWHPSMLPIAQLHREGKVSVLPAVGYAHPDQSHFTSRHFWEVGALDARLRTGWLGRVLDLTGSPDNPLQGLALGARLAPALAAARVPVAAIGSPREFDFHAAHVWGDVRDEMLGAMAELGAAHASSRDGALRQAGMSAVQAGTLRAQLAPFRPADGDDDAPQIVAPVPYPTSEDDELPERLAALAAMLGAGLPLRCVAVEGAGDYDTHDDQAQSLAENLALTAQSLLAFQRDLEARGLADRVLIHVWSEFGRRAEENGSSGTDHGAAGVGLVIGTRAAGRLVGEFPGLAKLDEDGNVRATSDFRALYATLAEGWLGVDAAAVVPGAAKLPRYAVLR